jgi:hypothetical protein
MTPHRNLLDAGKEVAARTPLVPDPAVEVPLIWPSRGESGGMRWIVATIPEMREAIARISKVDADAAQAANERQSDLVERPRSDFSEPVKGTGTTETARTSQ